MWQDSVQSHLGRIRAVCVTRGHRDSCTDVHKLHKGLVPVYSLLVSTRKDSLRFNKLRCPFKRDMRHQAPPVGPDSESGLHELPIRRTQLHELLLRSVKGQISDMQHLSKETVVSAACA